MHLQSRNREKRAPFALVGGGGGARGAGASEESVKKVEGSDSEESSPSPSGHSFLNHARMLALQLRC